MSEISPLPWSQVHEECATGWWFTRVKDARGEEIAKLSWAPKPQDADGVIGTYREANAKFIVRAVNCHDELVAALKETRDACAAALRVVAKFAPDMDDLLAELRSANVSDGFGARADAALQKAEATHDVL